MTGIHRPNVKNSIAPHVPLEQRELDARKSASILVAQRSGRMTATSRFAIALLLCIASIVPAFAAEVGTAPGWQKIRLGGPGNSYFFPVYANHRLDGDLAAIKRVLFVQHGRSRAGDAYFLSGQQLLKAHGIDSAETLLISPQFFTPAQAAKAQLDDIPAWSEAGFGGGEDSVAPIKVSSFQVLDDLLALLTDRRRLPALRSIVMAGHSGGGQLMQRFAILNRSDETLRAAGIEVRYVVANPGAYLYFTADRPRGDGFGPYDRTQCPTYNERRYGFDKLLPYGAGIAPEVAFRRYMARDVVYLLGTEDIDPKHPGLLNSCSARAQGTHRLERGRAYLRHERGLAAEREIPEVHRSFEVIGIAHDQEGMLGSACAATVIFGVAGSASATRCIDTTAARPATPGGPR